MSSSSPSARTTGWRAAVDELVASLAPRRGDGRARGGIGPVPRVRTFALTDFVEARLAREACLRGIAEHDPAAIIYCSSPRRSCGRAQGRSRSTRSLPRTGPAATGSGSARSSAGGSSGAPLVLAWSERSLEPLRGAARRRRAGATSRRRAPRGEGTARHRRGHVCRGPRQAAARLRARSLVPGPAGATRRWSSRGPDTIRSSDRASRSPDRLEHGGVPGAAPPRASVRRRASARGLRHRRRSRPSPTAACSSRLPRPGPTRRSTWPESSTRGSSATSWRRRCGSRSTIRSPDTPSGRRQLLEPFTPRSRRPNDRATTC